MAKYIEVECFCEELKKLEEMNITRPLGITMNIGLNQAIEVANHISALHPYSDNRGRWVWFEEGWWQCSECGCCPADWEPSTDNEYGLPPYCHGCGAEMSLEVE